MLEEYCTDRYIFPPSVEVTSWTEDSKFKSPEHVTDIYTLDRSRHKQVDSDDILHGQG